MPSGLCIVQNGLCMVCSKGFGTFEIAHQLDILAVSGKLCGLVVFFLINIFFAASSYYD
jgi:hypothetical protein